MNGCPPNPCDAPSARPRLRTDLRCSEQRDASGEVCIVKDPVADRFFRTGTADWRLARLLDGTRTVEEAVRALAAETGEEFELSEARQFVETLAGLGFLVDRPVVAVASRPRRDPLHARIRLGDPNRLFGRLARIAGPVFHPVFVAAALAAILGAVAVAFLRLGALEAAVARLLHWPALLHLWIPALALTALHEMAHGVACRRFGGEIHDMGLLLYYFQPCAYCDVSDAWMIPERARRLWVLGAGPFLEAFLWALAVFAWVLLPEGALAASTAVGVVATSGLKTLFNLNPLLKFDGYYLLSDALGIPNLRARAFEHLSRRLRGKPAGDGTTWRERAAFLAYAPLAAAWTVGVLGWFFVWLYAWLLDFAGAWGHAVFWSIAALVVLPAVFEARRRKTTGSAAAK